MVTGLLMLAGLAGLPANAAPTVLPTRFEADRVYVTPQTLDGRTLTLFTDSGGGLFIDERAVQRLGLATQAAPDTAHASDPPADAKWVRLPDFKPGLGMPTPQKNDGMLPVMPAAEAAKGWLGGDGMLGQTWFGGRVWTWDYPGQRLTLEGADWKPAAAATRVALGFKTGAGHSRETDFPRITIYIDGKPIDVLLDTGATTLLTAQALAALADGGPALRATSMIVDAQFRAWRKAHPDWRVVENAQERTHSAMIEVPEIEIGGARIGPVWFTWRPDKNFHEFMSGMMDKQVEGAIGGNALRHFVMTVDYPHANAYFRCAKDCAPHP